MKLIVTILEETSDAAMQAIRALDVPHDGIELRAKKALDEAPLRRLRVSTARKEIGSRRAIKGQAFDPRRCRG